MKSIIKGVLIVAAMLSFATVAGAEEAPTLPPHDKLEENISFNYGDNTFSVSMPEENRLSQETELTVMLVKGDYTNGSLAGISSDDVCYIGQAGGFKYSDIFDNLGVKYTHGNFEPGVYTLVTSGDGVATARTKIFLGNALDAEGFVSEYMHKTFSDKRVSCGTMERTFRVYEEDNTEQYIYVGIGNFEAEETVATKNLGFAIQMQDNGEFKRGYRTLEDLGVKALKNIPYIEGVLNIGIQINGLANGTDIVAIPYVIAE